MHSSDDPVRVGVQVRGTWFGIGAGRPPGFYEPEGNREGNREGNSEGDNEGDSTVDTEGDREGHIEG